jgi:hypothetical protein
MIVPFADNIGAVERVNVSQGVQGTAFSTLVELCLLASGISYPSWDQGLVPLPGLQSCLEIFDGSTEVTIHLTVQPEKISE